MRKLAGKSDGVVVTELDKEGAALSETSLARLGEPTCALTGSLQLSSRRSTASLPGRVECNNDGGAVGIHLYSLECAGLSSSWSTRSRGRSPLGILA